MSRIGRKPVIIPAGVTVNLETGNLMTVKGPKGTLSEQLHPAMTVEVAAAEINVIRPNDDKENRSLHGLTRSLIYNMVFGVTEGYKKELEINGVGYRAAKQGKQLVLNVGYSHSVNIEEPEGITIEVPAPNKIIVNGINKQLVGHITAEIRKQRPPEPYLGKGIKYTTETIRRKAGKSGK